MLIIRNEQMEALSRMMRRGFAGRMIAHLKRYVPEPCALLSEEEMVAAIDYGVEQAKKYDIVAERDVCKYITLMFTFGLDFDTNPRLPWVARLLDPESGRHAVFRIDELYEVAIEKLRHDPSLQVRDPGWSHA